MEKESKEIETDKFIRYHINIERAKEKWYNEEEISKLEKMIVLLDMNSKEEAKRLIKGDAMMIQNSIIYTAKEEGIKETQQQIALKMIEKEMDIETISQITGLKVEEIKQLKG